MGSGDGAVGDIIATSEEDPILAVVRFTSQLSWDDAGAEVEEEEAGGRRGGIGKVGNFSFFLSFLKQVADPQVNRLCLEAQDCMIMGKWLDLTSLMLTSADLVSSRVSVKDLECIFAVICNLVTRVSNANNPPDEAFEMAKLISTKLTQQPCDSSQASLRMKILFNLYNLLPENPHARFYVYNKALVLAADAKIAESIIPTFKKMDTFLKEWNIGKLDQRNLFLTIANILKHNKSFSKDHFHFLSKYLATFSADKEDDVLAISEAKDAAVQAIIEFVKSPDLFLCDLLDSPVVAQLEKDDKYASIHRLLQIFLTERLDAYLEFHAAESSVLKSNGLVHEDCVTKMRLMSLADLGSKGSSIIPYSLIKETLHIDEDDVENWVVKAITAKLLDCKMDQMSQAVIISRCTERAFGLQQWQFLRSKLQVWRNNVAKVVNTIQANKVSEDLGHAIQGLMTR